MIPTGACRLIELLSWARAVCRSGSGGCLIHTRQHIVSLLRVVATDRRIVS